MEVESDQMRQLLFDRLLRVKEKLDIRASKGLTTNQLHPNASACPTWYSHLLKWECFSKNPEEMGLFSVRHGRCSFGR